MGEEFWTHVRQMCLYEDVLLVNIAIGLRSIWKRHLRQLMVMGLCEIHQRGGEEQGRQSAYRHEDNLQPLSIKGS